MKSGVLLKQAEHRSAFQERYCIIREDELVYYDAKGPPAANAKPDGAIPLIGAAFNALPYTDHGRDWTFSVLPRHLGTFITRTLQNILRPLLMLCSP